jgi:hypothetical protein
MPWASDICVGIGAILVEVEIRMTPVRCSITISIYYMEEWRWHEGLL